MASRRFSRSMVIALVCFAPVLPRAVAAADLGDKKEELRRLEAQLEARRRQIKTIERREREVQGRLDKTRKNLEMTKEDRVYFKRMLDETSEEIESGEATARRERQEQREREIDLRRATRRLARFVAGGVHVGSAHAAGRAAASFLLARCRQVASRARVGRQGVEAADEALTRLYDARLRYLTFVQSAEGRSSTLEADLERRRQRLASLEDVKERESDRARELAGEKEKLQGLIGDLEKSEAAAQRPAPKQDEPEEASRPARRHSTIVVAPKGALVRSVESGLVWFAGPLSGWGNLVVLVHGDGFVSVYGYLSETIVQPNTRVARQQAVGRVGAVKGGAGYGVRFEVRRSDDEQATVAPGEWEPARGDLTRILFGERIAHFMKTQGATPGASEREPTTE